ncbi:MAG: PilZ domain-containing protein [Acidithiobacillus sp.]|uniref:PilZ domain-containing protein n=1 Tax=Acidithiobacillus sp. TaxID=1872118 RepID=UPI003D05B28C
MDSAAVELCGRFPLAWCSAPEDDLAFAAVMGDNLIFLKALLLLDGDGPAKGDDEQESLPALHTKVDLLLLMMSRGLRGLEPLSEPVHCCIDAQWLRWQGQPAGTPPASAGPVALALFLRPSLAIPLILPGTLLEEPPGTGGDWSGRCAHRLSGTVQECLDRLIFRHHRRSVARSRENP